MLHLRIHADDSPDPFGLRLGQSHHLFKGGDRVSPVEGRTGGPQLGQALAGTKGLQLCQGKVFGEPALNALAVNDLGRLAGGKLSATCDIRRATDLVFVAHDHDAILGQHQIRLDEVSPLVHGQAIGADGVFRPQSARPAVGNNNRAFGDTASGQGNGLMSQKRGGQPGDG